MPISNRTSLPRVQRPLLIAFLAFIVVLTVTGGASRPDVLGQAILRASSWTVLIGMILIVPRNMAFRQGRTVLVFLSLSIVLVALQLVPLPPDVWMRLPGRVVFAEGATLTGHAIPWRPLAIVPSATQNALESLVVPLAALCLIACENGQIRDGSQVKALLIMVLAIMIIGLLQFAGVPIYDPLVNRGDDIVGTFGNRNHFALLMACGILLAPIWAFIGKSTPGWRGLAVIALFPLLALSIVASGSRMGMLLGALALIAGLVIVQKPLRFTLAQSPRWVFPALIAGIVAIIGAIVLLSVLAGRALSVSRALELDPGEDMRRRSLTTVLAMIHEYLPIGSGVGGFDAVFRLHEPFDLLKPTYFNRAHNDFLEVILDAGMPGLALLMASVGWWAWASAKAWRAGAGAAFMLPKLGSALLLIIMIASIVDYPVRTPIMMTVVVVAAVWLSRGPKRVGPLPLPDTEQAL